jgi:hypothetical protein
MRFSTVVLLAMTIVVFSAGVANAEEPEQATGYNVPETTVVPLSLADKHPEIIVTDGKKSSLTKIMLSN